MVTALISTLCELSVLFTQYEPLIFSQSSGDIEDLTGELLLLQI